MSSNEFDSYPKRRSRVEIKLMSSNEVASMVPRQSDEVASLIPRQSDEVAMKHNLCRATKLRV